MYARLRRWFGRYKKHILDSYDPPRPTVYVLGKKKYIKKKVLQAQRTQRSVHKII